uniref:Uncharacterized protein n=1 Tax=Glossina palpalis gambiensis TaxID=67801 RepID=A0A1B0BKG8_9MUSC
MTRAVLSTLLQEYPILWHPRAASTNGQYKELADRLCLELSRALAPNPAINIFKPDNNNNNIVRIQFFTKTKLKQINKYSPAVTKVEEEWTNADTSVGAARAARSRDENGI